MGIFKVLDNSFKLLKDRPNIFLPKIFENLIFSFLWLYLANLLVNPLETTLTEVLPLVIVWGLLTPVHIWVFNSYIMMVQLWEKNDFSMKEAFKKGFYKIPETLGSMVITISLAIGLAIPGFFFLKQGIVNDSIAFVYLGTGWLFATLFSVFIISYLAPTSVILGDKEFKQNLKDGFKASNQLKGIIAVLTIITFGLLFVTIMLEGVFRGIGIAGYFVFRVLYAIINVYVLIINPSLLLSAKKADLEGVDLNLNDL